MPWWSWALLAYAWIGIEAAGLAYRSSREEFDAKSRVVWVLTVLITVALWPVIWWWGRRS